MKEAVYAAFEQTIPQKDTPLGARYDRKTKSCSFALWAPSCERVTLNIYRHAHDSESCAVVPLAYEAATGLWHGSFAGEDPEGWFYTYTVQNSAGINTVLDPYACALAAYRHDGAVGRAVIVDLQKASLKPLQEYPHVILQKREDAIIYEVSVRDFTISADAAVVHKPGTYQAFVEKIPYLQQLGITHVQLMPVLQFCATDETQQAYEDSGTVYRNNYNWGYNPHNYFTPEGWYASDAEDTEARILELRTLINECHKAGIGVLLDVVYNHMAKIDFLDYIVPGYYFRTDQKGNLTNASCCGNDMASERCMVRRLIVDSTVHWVRNYNVDGFRFDLMGLLDTETVLEAYTCCKHYHPGVLFIGEGWKMYNGASGTVGMDQNYMTHTDNVAVFNDELRDLVKAGGLHETGHGFLTGQAVDRRQLFYNCIGFPQCRYRSDSPGDNVQYLVCHDGLTLHDTIAHNCGLDETKPEEKKELIARIKLANVFALTCQGIAFLHAGQERGRSKPNLCNADAECIGKFVRNSYNASDSINQLVWTLDADYQSLLEYTRGLIALRRTYEVFRIGDAEKIVRAARCLPLSEENKLVFGYSIDWTDGAWFLIINASMRVHTVLLDRIPERPVVFADAVKAAAQGIENPVGSRFDKNRVVIDPCTAVIFRSANSFS